MTKAIATALLCCGCAAGAQAAQWITAAAWADPKGQPEAVWQYDQSSVRTTQGRTQAWMLTSFTSPQSADGRYPHLSRLERIALRCGEGTLAYSERLLYSRGYGRGVVVRAESFDSRAERFVAPKENTPGAAVMNAICGAREEVKGLV